MKTPQILIDFFIASANFLLDVMIRSKKLKKKNLSKTNKLNMEQNSVIHT